MRRAHTPDWRRMRRKDDPSNDLGSSSSHQSCPDCIIATRGNDFREGQLPNATRFGDLRRSTLSWCRRTRISASNAARGRNSPIKAYQINLQRSLIGREYQPIRGLGQPFWVCGRDIIHERHRFGSSHISLIEPLDAKTGILDKFVDRAVQGTATGQMLPGWGETIL